MSERSSLGVFKFQMWTQRSRPPLAMNWEDELRLTRVCPFWIGDKVSASVADNGGRKG